MRFTCEVCSKKFETRSYSGWMKHLTSGGHQTEVKVKYHPSNIWQNENNAYVVTGLPAGSSLMKILEWLSIFGFISEALFETSRNFCVFTLLIPIGGSEGPQERSIAGKQQYEGANVLIKPKNAFQPHDWEVLYLDEIVEISKDKTDNHNSLDGARPRGNPRNTFVDSPRRGSPRGTKVFFNSSRSSSTTSSQVSVENKKVDACAKQTSQPVTNEGEVEIPNGKVDGGSPKKKSRKKRTKPKQGKIDDLSELVQPQLGVESSSRNIANYPKLLHPTSYKSTNQPLESTAPKTENLVAFPGNEEISTPNLPTPEPLNFRGGFAYSRLESVRKASESSDGQQIGEQEGLHQIEESSNSRKPRISEKSEPISSNQKPVVSVSGKPKYTVLQKKGEDRPFAHSSQAKPNQGFAKNLTGLPPTAISNTNRNFRTEGNSSRGPPVNGKYSAPKPSHDISNSAFIIQVPVKMLNILSNPALPGRNPYKFAETSPPFSYFFQFFQDLPEEAYRAKKSKVYGECTKMYAKMDLQFQLDEFIAAQTLPQHEVRLRWQVILDTLYVIRQHYPKCEIYAFGSIITGLGDFDSDIDIYVDLVGETTCATTFDSSKRIYSQEALDIVRRIINRSVCPHSSRGNFAKRLVPVRSARVPILKLTHSATNISCDLSFENRLSVQNTKMLFLYLNMDPRVFRLMVLIRYWGKFHHITGSNHIKNYALNLLVVVYLVQKNILPKVLLLQHLKAEERQALRQTRNPDEIDGWDASFCDNFQLINSRFRGPQPNNTTDCSAQSLINMAIEFFDMYTQIDFSTVVICTLLGEIVPKQCFIPGNEESLPESLDRYKNWAVQQEMNRRLNINSYLCIQDPFVLSFNVGGVTPLGTLLRFQLACAVTSQTLKASKLSSLLDFFIPLASHIGEKKFIKAYRSQIKNDEVRKEMKTALGAEIQEMSIQQTPAPKKKSSFVTLPQHLSYLEGLLNEKEVKAALKKSKSETFLEIELNDQFESIFVTELTRGGIQLSKAGMTEKMCVLWKEFANDFLHDMFTKGMKLDTKRKDVLQEVVSGENDTLTKERKKRWNIKLPQEKLNATKSQEELNDLCKNIMALHTDFSQINYTYFQLGLRYPIWEKRTSNLLKKVVDGLPSKDKFHIEVKATASLKENQSKLKKGKPMKKDGMYRLTCINPIGVESRVSDAISQQDLEDTTKAVLPITFNIFVKLDVSSEEERPAIIFVFEKIPNQSCHTDIYNRVLNNISNILMEAFTSYQIYRLAKWLNLTTYEVNAHATSERETEEPPQRDRREEDGEDLVSNVDVEKSIRSKLENLLLPSSSSSTSSYTDLSETEEA